VGGTWGVADAWIVNPLKYNFNEAGVQIMSPKFEAQPEKPVLVSRDQ
jgi:hypothetical protein